MVQLPAQTSSSTIYISLRASLIAVALSLYLEPRSRGRFVSSPFLLALIVSLQKPDCISPVEFSELINPAGQ